MSEGTNYSYGDDVRDWVGNFLDALQTCADKKPWEREGIDCTWQHENSDRPELVVITEKQYLLSLVRKAGNNEETIDKKLRTAVKYYLNAGFLGILTDNRGSETQGAKTWRFTVKLWSKTDKKKNLEEFKKHWADCKIAKIKTPRQPGKKEPPSPPEINQRSNVPAGIRNPNLFVGRGNELEELHKKLQEQGQVAICAVAGMGGLGKTELAIQYARKYGAYYPKGICWLRGTDEQDIATQVVNFTLENFPDFKINRDLPAENQVRVCWKRWLTNPPPEAMLLIVDDVTDYHKVRPYVPQDFPKMRVIFTTRLQLPGSNIEEFLLDVLEPEAALELLKLVIGEDRIKRELENAERLCKWMEYLPLGLELVGWYLKQEPSLSIGELIINLQHRGLQHDAMRRDQNQRWTFTAERGVAAAFDLSWEKLDKETKRLGCLLSLFAAAPIPWQLVEMAEASRLAELGEDFNREHLRTYRRNLRALHLLSWDEGSHTYRLHQLIRRFFREKLEESANAN